MQMLTVKWKVFEGKDAEKINYYAALITRQILLKTFYCSCDNSQQGGIIEIFLGVKEYENGDPFICLDKIEHACCLKAYDIIRADLKQNLHIY